MTGLHWTADFVGLDYLDKGRTRDGVDCWGLIVLAFAAHGYTVPAYADDYVSVDEAAEVQAFINRATSSPLWLPVKGQPQELDVMIFRRGRLERHAGLYIRPGAMLHITAQHAQSTIEDPAGWAGRRTGTWRWHEVPA